MPWKSTDAVNRWRKAHPDEAKEQTRRTRKNRRMRALRLLSGGEPHCACCGWNQIDGPNRLEFDHINGGGYRLARRSHSTDVSMKILRGEGGFRVLCRACNAIMEPGADECVLHRSRSQFAAHLHFHSSSVYPAYMEAEAGTR